MLEQISCLLVCEGFHRSILPSQQKGDSKAGERMVLAEGFGQETFQLWFGCVLHCPGAHIHLGKEDAGVCRVGLLSC